MRFKVIVLFWGITVLLASCAQPELEPERIATATEIIPTEEIQATPVLPFSAGKIKPGQQLAFSFQSSSGVGIEYYLYLPKTYTAGQSWPLILSLHGFLGFNYTLESILNSNPLAWVDSSVDFPFIVVAPLGPKGLWSEYHEPMDELLDRLGDSLSINTQAIFLTGLSAGGTGAWQWALAYPDRFAGSAIVAGSPTFHTQGSVPENICVLKDFPLWVAYSDADMDSMINSTSEAINALKACGNTQIHLTIYPELSHSDSINTAYKGPEIYQWMLAQIQE
jgi:predicted peptidase